MKPSAKFIKPARISFGNACQRKCMLNGKYVGDIYREHGSTLWRSDMNVRSFCMARGIDFLSFANLQSAKAVITWAVNAQQPKKEVIP